MPVPNDNQYVRHITNLRAALTESPARTGQIVLGLFWLIDGLLQFQPYFFHHFASGVIAPNAAGQPGLIGDPITWLAGLIRPHQGIFTVFAALVESSVGIALLTRRAVKPALLLSFGWALNIWLTGEGLGGLLTGAAPDPMAGILNTAPMYIVAGLLVWPGSRASSQTDTGFGLLGELGARAMWAALWLGSAILWLLPANAGAGALRGAFDSAPAGAGWLSSLHSAAATAVGGTGTTITLALAVASAMIGLSVVWMRGTRPALVGSMAISLVFWVLGEGLGGLFTGQATDVGTAPLMVLIAALLLPLASREARAPSRLELQPSRVTAGQTTRA